VTWLGAVGRPTLLRVFPKVFSGTHVDHPAVTTYRARELRIEAAGQLAYADGERIGPLPVDVRVHPRVLRVLGTGAGLVT
jgi:diacylglycerol kinase (ATP)